MSFPLFEAEFIAQQVVDKMAPFCSRIEIAGSIRRRCRQVNDIEIVAVLKPGKMWGFAQLVLALGKLVKGSPGNKFIQIRLKQHITLDLFLAVPENWGMILAIRTGSAEYSRRVLATGWVIKGYQSEGGVLYPFKKVLGKDVLDKYNPVFLKEEKDVFDFIGIPWKEPKDRD